MIHTAVTLCFRVLTTLGSCIVTLWWAVAQYARTTCEKRHAGKEGEPLKGNGLVFCF